jgi:hypothetical protein
MSVTPEAEKPVHYDRLDDIVNSRPAFDANCVITRDNFAVLVGDYGFPVDALCQVESIEAKDRPCRNKHRKGYIGRRIDGKEGLIGSTCGPKYFEGHKGFASNLATVKREIDLDKLTERLLVIQADAAFLPRIDGLRERLQAVRAKVNTFMENLPQDVADRLRDMAKSRNADLRVAVEFVERVEDTLRPGKTRVKSNWLPRTIGSIASLSIVDRAPLFAVQAQLLSVRKAFDSLDASRELGGRKLAKQLKILDMVPNLETQVAAFEAAWSAFNRPDNLQHFWLLSRQQSSQLACLQIYSAAAGQPKLTEHQLLSALRDVKTKWSSSNEGRQIRPALE